MWRWVGSGGVTAKGCMAFFFKSDKYSVVMVAQLCEHTRRHWVAHFKWVSCMVYQ